MTRGDTVTWLLKR